MMEFIFGFLILALDIWAIVDNWSSPKSVGMKILWTAIILFLPVIGLILYVLLGRGRYASA